MTLLTYIINGISLGSVYAIIALGYTMVYGIAKMLNFAHGDIIMVGAYISYFAYLYRLNIGDSVYVIYNGVKYHYQIVNIYNVPKTGLARVIRNHAKTTLTMFTCTKNDDYSQTFYISELVS